MTKEQKQDLITGIDYQISAAAGAIELNNVRIAELIAANDTHAYTIQKANRERAKLVEELKP